MFLRLFSLVLSRNLATMQMAFLLDPVVSGPCCFASRHVSAYLQTYSEAGLEVLYISKTNIQERPWKNPVPSIRPQTKV